MSWGCGNKIAACGKTNSFVLRAAITCGYKRMREKKSDRQYSMLLHGPFDLNFLSIEENVHRKFSSRFSCLRCVSASGSMCLWAFPLSISRGIPIHFIYVCASIGNMHQFLWSTLEETFLWRRSKLICVKLGMRVKYWEEIE